MRRPVLSTQRIDLEPMTEAHLPLLVDLDSDPEVLRYILGRARSPREIYNYWGPICADTEADAVGLGWWVGRRRDDGDFLGWWDLSPGRPVLPQPLLAEAGWRLARRHWHQGFATEGATALLDHAFAGLSLELVWAETMAVNQPSRRVMTRLGMRHAGTAVRDWEEPLPGAEHGEVRYEVTAVEWFGRRPRGDSRPIDLRGHGAAGA